MSRKIKFRVWDIIEKRYTDAFELVSDSAFSRKVRIDFDTRSGMMELFTGDRYIIELDTGLKDKNGISICEGDLVRNCDKCHVDSEEVDAVKVTDDAYLLPFRSSFGSWSPELCEVIGNIHENPELLKIGKASKYD